MRRFTLKILNDVKYMLFIVLPFFLFSVRHIFFLLIYFKKHSIPKLFLGRLSVSLCLLNKTLNFDFVYNI